MPQTAESAEPFVAIATGSLILLAVSIAVLVVGLAFVWFRRGNWGALSVDSPGFHGILKGKVSVASVTAILIVGSMVGIGWSATHLTSDGDGSLVATVLLGKVKAIEELPPNPVPVRSDSHRRVLERIAGWYAAFGDARFVIDRGTKDGVAKGDWFATVSHPERLKDLPEGAAGNLQDELTSLIRCQSVYRTESVCTLESWAYDAHLRRCCSEGFAWKAGVPINLAPKGPVTRGQTVAAVPRGEKRARDQLDRWFARAEAASGNRRAFLYEEALLRANEFLSTYRSGFFAGDVLLIKGDIQAQLGRYKGAIATWETFQREFPFHPSARGVDDRIQAANEHLGTDSEGSQQSRRH